MFVNYLDLDQTFFLFYLKLRITQNYCILLKSKTLFGFMVMHFFIYFRILVNKTKKEK